MLGAARAKRKEDKRGGLVPPPSPCKLRTAMTRASSTPRTRRARRAAGRDRRLRRPGQRPASAGRSYRAQLVNNIAPPVRLLRHETDRIMPTFNPVQFCVRFRVTRGLILLGSVHACHHFGATLMAANERSFRPGSCRQKNIEREVKGRGGTDYPWEVPTTSN